VNATAKQQLRRNVLNDPYSNPTKIYSVPATTNEDGTLNIPAQAVYGIDPNHEPIDAYMAVRSSLGGTPVIVYDDAANNSAKTYTTPVGKKRKIEFVAATITATATVGNRSLRVDIQDATPTVLYTTVQSANITANQVGTILIGNGGYAPVPAASGRRVNVAAAVNVGLQDTFPGEIVLPAGYSIKVWDITAVDAAADDLVVTLVYTEYDA